MRSSGDEEDISISSSPHPLIQIYAVLGTESRPAHILANVTTPPPWRPHWERLKCDAMSDSASHTPIYDWHVAHQGRIVEFGGWMMPVQYTSIVEEHHATRKAVGLFDISHMGRLRFDGSNAAAFLDGLVTRRVVGMGQGKIRYALM